MSIYTFSKRNDESLHTPIFAAGKHGQDESVIVFTDAAIAERFRRKLDWQDEEAVVVLEPPQLLKWLIELSDAGVEYLAVNPEAEDYRNGETVPTLEVRQQLEQLGGLLQRRIQEFPRQRLQQPGRSVRVFHCNECGNSVERRHGNLTPKCCGGPMVLVSRNSEESTM